MRVLLWLLGWLGLIVAFIVGAQTTPSGAAILPSLVAGAAILLVFGWMAEMLAAVQRAADSIERIEDAVAPDEEPTAPGPRSTVLRTIGLRPSK